MQSASSKLAIGGVEQRTQQGHQENQASPAEALGKSLGVPGKEGYRPYDGEVEKATFDPPVDSGGRAGIGMRMIQDYDASLINGGACERNLYCKQLTQWSEVELLPCPGGVIDRLR